MRKHYSDTFKAEVVLELLKEEKSVAQIASEYHVHPNQVYEWKATALKGLASLFSSDHKAESALKAELRETPARTVCRDWPIDDPSQLAQKKIWPRI